MSVFAVESLVVSTGAINCPERPVSEMIYYLTESLLIQSLIPTTTTQFEELLSQRQNK